jgi:hypothetical protein
MTLQWRSFALAAVVRLDAEHLRALLPRFLRATVEGGAHEAKMKLPRRRAQNE